MPLWPLPSRNRDKESDVALESAPELQQYEIELDPPTPLLVYLTTAITGRLGVSTWTIHRQKVVIAVCLNFVCAIYQSVDLYKDTFPGSKVAANILRSDSSLAAWYGYFWVLAIAATVANFWCAPEFIHWFTLKSRMYWWGPRMCCMSVPLMWLASYAAYCLILPTLFLGPMWIVFALRYIWGPLAWTHGCSGWDYTITINVNVDLFYSAPLNFLGNVTVAGTDSNYTMSLFQFNSTPWGSNEYLFNITEAVNIAPAIASIAYNMTSSTYTIASSTSPFTVMPNLQFPTLDISQRDPSIPFLRPDQGGYPPSADLVSKNGTRLLHTVTENFPGLSELLACGMEADTGAFQIALGVVAIEQWIQLNVSDNVNY
jgi:hypothetical protein